MSAEYNAKGFIQEIFQKAMKLGLLLEVDGVSDYMFYNFNNSQYNVYNTYFTIYDVKSVIVKSDGLIEIELFDFDNKQ